MTNAVNILIVEDVDTDAELAQREIRKVVKDCEFHQVETQEDFLGALKTFQPDLIISDYSMPRFNGLKALELTLQHAPLTPFIVWTGSMSEDTAVECMKAGAHNYIIKENIKRLGPAVVHALGERQLLIERKQAEIRYRALFEQSHDAIFIIDFEGRFLAVNQRASELLGYSHDELLSLSVHELSAETDESDRIQQRLMNGELIPAYERMLRKKDGATVPVEINVELVRDAHGEPLHIQSMVRDITERKQAEENARKQELRFRALIENSLDNISLLAPDGTLLWENPAVNRTLGYRQDEHIGQDIFQLMHPDDLQQTQSQFMELLKTPGAHQTGTFRLLHHNGTWRWIEAIATNLLDEPSVGAVVINYRDITERKQSEIEIQKRTDDLAMLNAINEAVIRGEKLNVVVDLLSSGLKRIFSSVGSTIYMLDPGGQSLTMQQYNMSSALVKKIEALIGGAIPLVQIPVREGGFFYNVLKSSRGVITSNPADIQKWMEEFTETDFLPQAARSVIRKLIPQIYKVLGIRSTIIVPLISNGRTIGLLDVSSPELFTVDDLERVERIGGQLTAAIQRQRAYEEVQRSEEFLQSVQNALSAHVAILDEQGTIVRVNSAWRKFGEQNGFEHRLHGVGLNYLEICDSAQGPYSEEAPVVAQAIRDVLAGRIENARVEYPCHSYGEKRWFIVQITKFKDADRLWVVMAHENITERKEAELQSAYQAHLLSNVRDAVLSFDEEFVITSWNQAAEDMYGWSAEEVLGKPSYEVLVTEFTGMTQEQAIELLRSTGQFQAVVVHTTKDGRKLFVDARASALRDPYGELIYVAVNRDITERKQSENALRESEERFRSLFDRTLDGVYRSTHDGRFVDINTAMVNMFGYSSREEMLAVDIKSELYFSPEERGSHLLDTGQEEVDVYPMRRKDGSVIWVEDHGSYVHDEHGNILYHEGILRDVTQRKIDEMALQESQSRYQSLFENSPISLWEEDFSEVKSVFDRLRDAGVTDFREYFDKHPEAVRDCLKKVKVLDVNRATLELLQTDEKSEVIGTLDTSLSDEALHNFKQELTSLAEGHLIYAGEEVFYTKRGHKREIFFNLTVAPGYEKTLDKVFVSIIDITERKQAEDLLRQSQRDLSEAQRIAHIGNWRYTPEGNVIQWSEELYRIFGVRKGEFEDNYDAFVNLVHPDDRQLVRETNAKALSTGEPFNVEYRIITPGRVEKHISEFGYAVTDSSNKIISLFGTAQDITNQKQAEHEKNERLKELTCLYAVRSEMSRNPTIDELCRRIIEHVSYAMQFPEITAPVIEIDGRRFTSDKYREDLTHHIGADILIGDTPVGRLCVYYTEEKPFIFPEEHSLVTSIADDLKLWLETKRAEEKLRSSEERFRQLAENIQEVFWMTDAITGEELYISPASNSVWGRTVEGMLHTPDVFINSVHPDDRATVQQMLEEQRRGIHTEMEYRIARPDGSVRWIWDRAFPIFDEEGKVVRLTGIAADITERKQAEDALRDSEKQYRSLFENLVDGFALHEIILDDDGNPVDYIFLEINSMFEKLTGIKAAEAVGRRVTEFLPGVENDRFIQIYGQVALTGEPVHLEEYSSPLGRYFEINAYSPKLGQFAVTFTDITERKQAEDALRDSQVKFAGVVNSAMDAVISVDADQRIILFNPAAERMFGCPASEAIGELIERFIPDRFRSAHKKHISNFGDTGITNRAMGHLGTLNGLRIDGTEFPIEASISHIEAGEEHIFTVILRDITERKQAEEQLRKLSRAVEQSASTIVITDTNGSIEYVNPKFTETTGYTFDEALGQNPRILKSDQTPPSEYVNLWQTITNGNEWHGELQNRKKNGELYWESVTISPIFNENKEPTHFIAVKEDITEKKRTEAEIERHLGELQALYENGLAVSRLLEPRQIGERIIDTFNEHLFWHHVTIRLLKAGSKDELELVAYSVPHIDDSEMDQAAQEFSNRITTVGQGMSGWVVQTGEAIRTGNVQDYPQYVGVYEEILSGLYMPLRIGKRVIGVISVESEQPDAFSEQDERLLATLANQAAVAFENARLYQSVQQELAERRRMERELRTSETHYRELADSITDIFFELDENMRYTHWNKASEMLTGFKESDAIGKTMEEIFGDSMEQSRISAIYEGVLKSQKPKTFETIFRVNQEKHSFEINAYPSTRGVAVVAKDVTERKQSELLKQKRFELMDFSAHNSLDALMQKTMDEICELTNSEIGFFHLLNDDQNDLSVQVWSTKALELFNVAEGEGMHKPVDQAGAWAEAVRQRRPLIQNDFEALPYRKGMPEGHASILREIIVPIIRNEQIMAVMGVGNKPQDYTSHDLDVILRLADHAWDITELKRVQTHLAEERNQLAQRVEERTGELIKANTNLARALRVKDEFLANMSHELRTPLNAILGLSESLSEQIAGPLNDKQLKYITTIGESGHHLLSLINDILDLAKIEAGQITLDVNKVDVQSVCQASLRMVKQLAQKKNQEVRLNVDVNIGLIWADERRLKQMLVNLLSNAVKFTPDNGILGLDVRGFQDENRVEFSVWDNGIGIPEKDIERLFKPFVQLDSGLARESTGTGLGLALVSQMARLHGGGVNVSSNPGEGSRFTIVLPWEPVLARETVDRLKTTGQLRLPKNDRSTKKKILLIEDTLDVIMMIQDYLETAGYDVTAARDGIEGIEQARLIIPDLILMDVQMPRMDGIEATRKLRADPQFRHVPILALTALAMPNDRERCLEAGMNEYISKPVNLKTLVKLIQKSLSKGEEKTRPL